MFASNLKQKNNNIASKNTIDILTKNLPQQSYYLTIQFILTSLQDTHLRLNADTCNIFLKSLAEIPDRALVKALYATMIEHSTYDFYTFSTVIKIMQDDVANELNFAESVFTQAVKLEKANNFTINNFLCVIKSSAEPDLSKVHELIAYAEKNNFS